MTGEDNMVKADQIRWDSTPDTPTSPRLPDMPTGRTARFTSPVNVSDFDKVISVIGLNERGLRQVGPAATRIAHAEGLTAHAAAVERRLERLRPE